MNYVLETLLLTKAYRRHLAVDRVDMHVAEGTIYGLLGQNGAGKSTLMKLITALARPSSGDIFLFGEKPKKENLCRVGSLIESPAFYHNLTARENLKLLTRIRGTHKNSDEAISYALYSVGLEDNPKQVYGKFSLGMKQRLGIAAAIIHDPDLLILDEPTNALDPVGIQYFRELFLKLKKQGKTLIVASHILSELERIVDTVGVMHGGKLIEEIDLQTLNRRRRRYVEITVSDDGKAAMCLEQRFPNIDFTVLTGNRIRIYNEFELRGKINTVFNRVGISVTGITVDNERLEDYFTEIIGGTKFV